MIDINKLLETNLKEQLKAEGVKDYEQVAQAYIELGVNKRVLPAFREYTKILLELVANIATLEPFNGDYDSYEINKQSITSIINEINFE